MHCHMQSFKNYTLEKIMHRQTMLEREALTTFGYHLQDATAPTTFTHLAVLKVLLSHPVALLTGQEEFITELVSVIVEVLARSTTIDRRWHRMRGVVLPGTIKEVIDSLSKITEHEVTEQTRIYQGGCYRFFGVADQPLPREIEWNYYLTSRREDSTSEAVVTIGNRRTLDLDQQKIMKSC